MQEQLIPVYQGGYYTCEIPGIDQKAVGLTPEECIKCAQEKIKGLKNVE